MEKLLIQKAAWYYTELIENKLAFDTHIPNVSKQAHNQLMP